jgi:hypothetical protein
LVTVDSSTWHSIPMTVSYRVDVAAAVTRSPPGS